MSVIVANPPGSKLGNATMSWLHAYAHAQRTGSEFLCGPWIGEEVWDLPKYGRPTSESMSLPVRSEIDLGADETNVVIRGYAQNQKAMIYTKAEAIAWLRPKLTPQEIFNDDGVSGGRRGTAILPQVCRDEVVAHWRNGDFKPYGYPVCSIASIIRETQDRWPDRKLTIISEEHPTPHGNLPESLSMLPDFFRMVAATILLRANSSFSWVAALLNTGGRVMAPVIDGLTGGTEHNVKYMKGNWPKLSNLEGCTDLDMKGDA